MTFIDIFGQIPQKKSHGVVLRLRAGKCVGPRLPVHRSGVVKVKLTL
jgi:hypothetical protein